MTVTATADAERRGFEAALADVAEALAAGVRPLGPSELTRVRARRRLLRTVASSQLSDHHDQPAA